jgi:hypothetical protein
MTNIRSRNISGVITAHGIWETRDGFISFLSLMARKSAKDYLGLESYPSSWGFGPERILMPLGETDAVLRDYAYVLDPGQDYVPGLSPYVSILL